MLENIRIVLVETSHPGNIGATARAMKTMGLRHLYLVNPENFPNPEATARAVGADDLLEQVVVCQSLSEAIADCQLVFAASARSRSLEWPHCDPREAASIMSSTSSGSIAILFGNERSGLSNEDLMQSHFQIHIPVNPNFSSLNLAAAVQVITYELYVASCSTDTLEKKKQDPLASHEEVSSFYQHLEETLMALEYLDPKQPRQLMRRLHRLFNRSLLTKVEINILRGVLSAIDKKIQK